MCLLHSSCNQNTISCYSCALFKLGVCSHCRCTCRYINQWFFCFISGVTFICVLYEIKCLFPGVTQVKKFWITSSPIIPYHIIISILQICTSKYSPSTHFVCVDQITLFLDYIMIVTATIFCVLYICAGILIPVWPKKLYWFWNHIWKMVLVLMSCKGEVV